MEALNFFVEPNRHIEQLCAAYGPRTHPLLQVNDDRSSQLIMSYRETRQSGLIPWGILAAVMVLFQFVPLFGDSVTLLRTIALLLSLLFLGLGMRRFLTPREVFIISEDEVCLQGLRPGGLEVFSTMG